MDLEAAAIEWLRYEQHCPLVCVERSPVLMHGRPDVMGVTKRRMVIEIEVKRTVSDFRNNHKKRSILWREQHLEDWPWKFYFMVSPSIVAVCKGELPEYAGLLTIDDSRLGGPLLISQAVVVKGAPRHDGIKLSKLQVARMVMHQSGTLVGFAAKIAKMQSGRKIL